VVISVSMLVHSHATANIPNLAVEAAQPRQIVQGAVCEASFGNATRLCEGPPGLATTNRIDCNDSNTVCTILAWLGTTTISTVVSGLGPTDTVTQIFPTASATPTGSSTAPVSSANPTSSTTSVTTGPLVPSPGKSTSDPPAATSSSSSQSAPAPTHSGGAASDRIRGGFLGLAVIGGAVAAAAM
jgi:hypothetical protein